MDKAPAMHDTILKTANTSQREDLGASDNKRNVTNDDYQLASKLNQCALPRLSSSDPTSSVAKQIRRRYHNAFFLQDETLGWFASDLGCEVDHRC